MVDLLQKVPLDSAELDLDFVAQTQKIGFELQMPICC